MAHQILKARKREDYGFQLEYPTRWSDNDMYGHVNNSAYYYLFDSVVNTYLAKRCHHSPMSSSSVGLVVHSHCDYFLPASFPALLDVCLRVNKLGNTSVTYEIAVFEQGHKEVRVVGEFVHVFVQRETRAPLEYGMEVEIRRGLQKLALGDDKGLKQKL